MSEQDNIAIAKSAYENFMSGDIQAMLNTFADDITWDLPKVENIPFTGSRSGRAGVAEFFQLVGEYQEPLTFNRQDFVAQGDKVVVLGNYTWKVKSNGREFSGEFAHVFTIRGGKVVSFREYFDSAVVAAAYK